MREFYIIDKVRNIAYRGVKPTNEINCLPLDFCKYPHAEIMFGIYNEMLKHTCPFSIPENVVRNFVLEKVEEQIETMLSSTALKQLEPYHLSCHFLSIILSYIFFPSF